MKIKTGHRMIGEVKTIDAAFLRFVCDDDEERVLFEIRIGSDGRSLEVRAVDTFVSEGELYSNRLRIDPVVSNVVRVSTIPYEEP